MNLIYPIVLVCLLLPDVAFAGNYPFPQNANYTYGIKPAGAKHQDALKSYNNWKNIYVVDAGSGRKRVLFGDLNNSTVSEGIAYGMLIAAYADDQIVFDGLWNYYKSYMNSHGVMNWKIRENGTVEGFGGATDAEEDAAMALIIADQQWGSAGAINYKTDAITLINNMMLYEVAKPSYMLKAGDQWGTADVTNPSYFAPAYYRIYYQITGDTQWLQVLEKCYTILSLNADPNTGLVTDWCRENGTQTNQSWQKFEYSYDAARFPWRMATDYLWFGEPRAKEYCIKMANFVKSIGGTTRIVDGYTITGTKIGTAHNSTFVGTFALTAMADPSFQAQLNASYNDNVKTNPGGYFDQMLHTLSMFMLTGNFYRLPSPECQSFTLGPDLNLCIPPHSYMLDPQIDVTNRTFKWNTGETTPTITVSKKGNYILEIDSFGCIRKDTVFLMGLAIDLGQDVEMLVGDSVMLNANASGDGVTYIWNTNETSQSIVAASKGLFWVQVDSAGCTYRDTIYIYYQESEEIKVYPNPNGGRFKVLLHDPRTEKAEVTVFNTQGKMVFKTTYSGIRTGEPFSLDFSSLATGIYILRIKTPNAVKSKKIVKH